MYGFFNKNIFRHRNIPRVKTDVYPVNFQDFVVDVVKTWYSLDAKSEGEIRGAMRNWAYVEHGNRNASKPRKRKVH